MRRACASPSPKRDEGPAILRDSGAIWSGTPGSNRRPSPWQGDALPAELVPRNGGLIKPRLPGLSSWSTPSNPAPFSASWTAIVLARRRGEGAPPGTPSGSYAAVRRRIRASVPQDDCLCGGTAAGDGGLLTLAGTHGYETCALRSTCFFLLRVTESQGEARRAPPALRAREVGSTRDQPEECPDAF